MNYITNSLQSLQANPFNPADKIPKELVHKREQRNVVISSVQRVSTSDTDLFECYLTFDDNLPFFFEHHLDHIPGLLIIEAARQMGTATLHKFFDIRSDFSFVLDNVDCEFLSYAELHAPVRFQMTVKEEVPSGKVRMNRREFRSSLRVFQAERCCARMSFGGTCLSPKLIARLRAGID